MDGVLNRKQRRDLAAAVGVHRSSRLLSWRTISKIEVDENGEEHHSHRHLFSISTGSKDHFHYTSSGATDCGYAAYSHAHNINSGYTDAHTHIVSGYTGWTTATDLNHTHTVAVTSGSGGSAHTHTISGNTTSSACAGCLGNTHNHPKSGTYASGGGSHTHTFSGDTGTGIDGDVYNHRHAISLQTASGDSHNHGVGTTAISNANCYRGYSHNHTSPTSVTVSHTHAVSGYSDYDGEPSVNRRRSAFFPFM